MTQDEVLAEFRAAGALLEGHFILSSGLRSPVFLQKMFVFQDPARTARLCAALAEKIRARFGAIDIIVSPAVGGIVPGYETARQLGAFWPSYFMLPYLIAGLWLGGAFVVIGTAIIALTLIGYLSAGPWFDLWMALVCGGGLLLGGLWMRRS